MEGAINGIPSIAVSLDSSEPTMLPHAAEFTRFLCAQLRGRNLQASLLLNVNIPNLPPEEIRGIEITSLGLRKYEKVVHQREDPRGRPYYWIAGDIWDDKDGDGTDVVAMAAGKISVTPLHFNLTNYEMLGKLKSWRLEQVFNFTVKD
jgi:5'-nucleotidase